MTKRCSNRHIEKTIDSFYKDKAQACGYQSRCKECKKLYPYAKYTKRYFASKKGLQTKRREKDNHPEKFKARKKVSNAIRDGKLFKQPCKVCGALKVEAHHKDYTKPLEVDWLCKKHHMEADKELK